MMRDLHIVRLEFDEIWSFVGKKQKHAMPEELPHKGDQYIFIGLASTTKAIVGYRIGKRDDNTADEFCFDLRDRILGEPEISPDGYSPYIPAIRRAFAGRATHGQIVKKFAGEGGGEASRRYSPGQVIGVERAVVSGSPRWISTSYVERSNLSMRMGARRMTRLTNPFSKKLENHAAAISLYITHYNFCRVHETIRTTPAVALGITDRVWTIGDLINAATVGEMPAPKGRRVGHLRVIEGGR